MQMTLATGSKRGNAYLEYERKDDVDTIFKIKRRKNYVRQK